MRKLLVANVVVLVICLTAVIAYFQNMNVGVDPARVCQSYKIGQKIEFDSEKSRLEALGMKIGVAIAGEAGHDTRMLMVEAERAGTSICEIQVRDGIIFAIR